MSARDDGWDIILEEGATKALERPRMADKQSRKVHLIFVDSWLYGMSSGIGINT